MPAPYELLIDVPRAIVSPSLSRRDVTLHVRAGRIVALQSTAGPGSSTGEGWTASRSRAPTRITIPHGVVMPGLVNAHTHLDLTGLGERQAVDDPRPAERGPGGDFIAWLRDLVARRARLDEGLQRHAIVTGIERSIRAGSSSIGDIDSFGLSGPLLSRSGLRGVAFREVLGIDDDAVTRAWSLLEGWEAQHWEPGSLLRRGFSPHAPYSCSEGLIRMADRLARDRGWAVAIHAAETLDERHWLERGAGPLGDLLQGLFVSRGGARSPRRAPLEILSRAAFLGPGRSLVHANFVRGEEIDLVARSGSPVVYCPRSHAFFGHPPHPVAEMRSRGIAVGLGSDSVASGGTLSILDEMAMLRRRRPDLESHEILEMATVGGHRALGSSHPGTLVDGGPADLIGLCGPRPLPPDHAGLLEWICSGQVHVVLCMVAGRILARAPDPVVQVSAGTGQERIGFGAEPASGGEDAGRLDLPLILG